MLKRNYKVKKNDYISSCPKCGNNTEFSMCANQVAEDMCEQWVECKCGYDPSAENTLSRLEDVWGGVTFEDFKDAIKHVWNDLLTEKQSDENS